MFSTPYNTWIADGNDDDDDDEDDDNGEENDDDEEDDDDKVNDSFLLSLELIE